MKKHHTEAVTTPARTTFRFSQREVAEALAHYIENIQEQEVPKGERSVLWGDTPTLTILHRLD